MLFSVFLVFIYKDSHDLIVAVFMLVNFLLNNDLESVKHLPKQAGITILTLFGLVVILPGIITSAAGGHPILSLFDRLNAVGSVVVHLNRINHLAVARVSVDRILEVVAGHPGEPNTDNPKLFSCQFGFGIIAKTARA